MAAVWKERRPAMGAFVALGGECCSGCGRPSRRWNAMQWARQGGAEDDHSTRTPRAARAVRGVAERDDRPSRRRDLLQLLIGEEADGRRVRRPERIGRAIGAADDLRRERSLGAGPTALFSARHWKQ